MTITLSYGGATFAFPNLLEQPLVISGDAARGRTVRGWSLAGIVSRAEAAAFVDLYEAWRAAKFLEDDPRRTGVVGATVALTGSSPGFAWTTPVPCWFTAAPAVPLAGAFIRLSATVEDAAASLAVLLREGEEEAEQTAQLGLGTLTLGGAVITLVSRPDGIGDLPSLNLSPAGRHLITGPLATTETRQVNGYVTAAHLPALEAWVKATAAATPATGDWFPTSWTDPVARRRADGGAMAGFYDVSFSLVRIR
jgi:hypothetical protein